MRIVKRKQSETTRVPRGGYLEWLRDFLDAWKGNCTARTLDKSHHYGGDYLVSLDSCLLLWRCLSWTGSGPHIERLTWWRFGFLVMATE
jgi:hypothetical protein